jgi:response regulator RpfG family c-di-GMP phosphodiesterase
MNAVLKRRSLRLSKEDIQRFEYFEFGSSTGFLATAFSKLSLPFKRHCIQVGAVAGLMAMQAPQDVIFEGMTRDEYANAVRYGGFYHDIGAYLVHNQYKLYPDTGSRILREELIEAELGTETCKVTTETVQSCCERYDGQGYPDELAGEAIPFHAMICAIAKYADRTITGKYGIFHDPVTDIKKHIIEQSGSTFSPEAVECYLAAHNDIEQLYRHWRKNPPAWRHSDVKPLERPIEKSVY